MSKGVHNIAFYVSPDPECSRTTQNSEISLAPSRGRILYAIYGNSTCVINHIVVTAIDKMYRNYYVSTFSSRHGKSDGLGGDLTHRHLAIVCFKSKFGDYIRGNCLRFSNRGNSRNNRFIGLRQTIVKNGHKLIVTNVNP